MEKGEGDEDSVKDGVRMGIALFRLVVRAGANNQREHVKKPETKRGGGREKDSGRPIW